jgi:hypothetical protein
MYRKIGCWLVVALMFTVASVAGDDGKVYGEGVTGKATVPIAKLLAKPDSYVDQVVRVEGTVKDVCPRAGCWIDIASKEQAIRFKVQDGVIEFPMESKGQTVIAEGVFTRIEMTREQALSWAEHLAEERGEKFDPQTAEVATTIYRIEGTGALMR